jgi:anti-sigma regulatory factor (Ser/Thr protein kinase)
MTAGAVRAAARCILTRSYPGQRKQIRLVRAALALVLKDFPLVADAVLIASEMAANAVVHSDSAAPGGWFTVRAEVSPGEYVRIEVDDQGGRWTPVDHNDGRPHGLDLIDAIAGAGNWGIHGDAQRGRTAWARLDWPAQTARMTR